jgi:FAD synthetase
MTPQRRVMCFGTFDIVHPGHVKFLAAARALGDELFVVVSRDERRKALSGITPVHTQRERIAVLSEFKSVSRAIAGKKNNILTVVKQHRPDVIALGHDQVYGIDTLAAWSAQQKKPPRIVRLRAFNRKRHSTTRIKQVLCQ